MAAPPAGLPGGKAAVGALALGGVGSGRCVANAGLAGIGGGPPRADEEEEARKEGTGGGEAAIDAVEVDARMGEVVGEGWYVPTSAPPATREAHQHTSTASWWPALEPSSG